MSLLERLIGATPEKQEQKGDRLLTAGRWGEAKLAYESALDKLARHPAGKSGQRSQLNAKIRQARDALAREHRQSANDLIEGGHWEEAREMLALAIEVSVDENLKRKLEHDHREFESRWLQETAPDLPVIRDELEGGPAAARPEDADENYFRVLCHTLPDPVRQAYQRYGDDFKQGYTALNRGDFEIATRHLERAHQDAPQPDSHIPLELATAYLNLNRKNEARDLLVAYRRQHPDILPAYQLLCEIYWDKKEFTQAVDLLDNLPPDLSASLAAATLKGETLERIGQREAARDHYRRFLDAYGWDPRMTHKLARVCRDLDDTDEALKLYRQIMESCRGCAPRIAPQVRHEYAELCFEAGRHDVTLLELYLALVREIPDNAALYYTRVAHIYDQQGHDHEARRFRNFARQVEASAAGIALDETDP